MRLEFRIPDLEWENIQDKYPLGTVIETTLIKKIDPSILIIEFVSETWAYLRLSNLGWNLAQSQQIYNSFKVGDKLNIVIVAYNEVQKIVEVSHKELLPIPSDIESWSSIKLGDRVKGRVIESFASYVLVEVQEGIFGYVSKDASQTFQPGSEGEFLVISKNSKKNHVALRTITEKEQSLEEQIESDNNSGNKVEADFLSQDSDVQSLENYKRSNLRTFATATENDFLKKAFTKDNSLFSKILQLQEDLCVTFQLNSNPYEFVFRTQFLNSLESKLVENKGLIKLQEARYWCKETRSKSGDAELTLFNNEVLIKAEVSKEEEHLKFIITSFEFGNKQEWSGKSKNWSQQNGCFLLHNKVLFLSPYQNYPANNTQANNLELIQNKFRAFKIYDRIITEQGSILKEEGLALQIFDKFLEYQADKNTKDNQVNEIAIELGAFERIFKSEYSGVCIRLNSELESLPEIPSEDEVYVDILVKTDTTHKDKNKNRRKVGFAKLLQRDDAYDLVFISDIELEVLEDGFYILPTISNKQYTVQREIINDFFSKKIKLQHIENLLINPEKIKSPVIDHIDFINPRLQQTNLDNPNNRQIAAVQKAVGNQNILLIQGPPGTGKTTVIAEVVQQLVNQGKKVLVSSQTHIAVDNVLEKLSEQDDLSLLRVGAYDKLDDKIACYHINGWRNFYSQDYTCYQASNIKIVDSLISDPSILNNESRKEFIDHLITTYSELLKEHFRNKHYEFLQVIKNYSKQALQDLSKILVQWKDNFTGDDNICDSIIYNSVNVAFGTCIGIKTDKTFNEHAPKFDAVIIDEAGKANLSESFVPISLAKKVILVGDQMQLPPYIDGSLLDINENDSFPNTEFGKDFLQEDIEHALKTSFFEFMVNKAKTKEFPASNIEMLNYQHRMHPNIGQFVSEAFYEGKLKMGEFTHLNRLALPVPFDKELIFIDTSTAQNPYEERSGESINNIAEAMCIADHILPKLLNGGVKQENIAVISPYKSQVKLLRNKINSNPQINSTSIDVSTLDSFQGMEYDIIVFSFTRSASPEQRNKKVGFLDDARRLNVAFSRAKKKLILVGNAHTLTDSRSHYDILFNYTGLFKKLVSICKDKSIGNFVEMVDFADIQTPFKDFCQRYSEGDIVKAEFIESDDVSHKFKLNDELWGNFYDPRQYNAFEPGVKYDLTIHKIDFEKKQVNLGRTRKKKVIHSKQYKVGQKVMAKYKSSVSYGHFFTLCDEHDGLLYDPLKIRNFNERESYELLISKVEDDKNKLRINLQYILEVPNLKQGEVFWGCYCGKVGKDNVFLYDNYEIHINGNYSFDKGQYYLLRVININSNSDKVDCRLVREDNHIKGRFSHFRKGQPVFKTYKINLALQQNNRQRYERSILYDFVIKTIDNESKEVKVELK